MCKLCWFFDDSKAEVEHESTRFGKLLSCSIVLVNHHQNKMLCIYAGDTMLRVFPTELFCCVQTHFSLAWCLKGKTLRVCAGDETLRVFLAKQWQFRSKTLSVFRSMKRYAFIPILNGVPWWVQLLPWEDLPTAWLTREDWQCAFGARVMCLRHYGSVPSALSCISACTLVKLWTMKSSVAASDSDEKGDAALVRFLRGCLFLAVAWGDRFFDVFLSF